MVQHRDEIDLALIQADLFWQDPESNRAHLARLMDRQPGCDLYVLPETFTTGFLGDIGQPAEDMDGPSVQWMQEQARARRAALCGSLVIESEPGQRRNRMVFVTPEGSRWFYDKRHRFAYGGEDERYVAGERPTVVEWLGWRIDLQVCYDLRFPVWCRNDRDFDLQLYVANWPAPRADHWRSLLKARAIENQAYVVGVNRSGVDGNDIPYPGCSVAWSMEGQLLLELGAPENVARVRLQRSPLRDYRRQFAFLGDADRFSLTDQPD
ncbi:amidohydrolase [Wenzhouxiangella sp. AB-CW3]|uniref:amidohydrolase n=1 Tax=Wenzhouxiangella sp. AB-CW3 TaxID=2771012 RepID=UPI00168BE6B4|nr:amidohydrolase [Wenzhouxiangella sp. AB-CW3]QOC21637.1 amidohydrolase [Wenzhouxiangella sp. AB-CW3]